eukprot:m.20720 g.20720  ORF g.20720 m.20720 type:complete len:487 (-) comp6929_c0_seq1:115-1575(-)
MVGLSLLALITLTRSAPEQIHLAFGNGRAESGSPNSMSVSWYTSDATQTSTVQYGVRGLNMTRTATGYARQYLEGYGYHHHVELTSLLPGREYDYKVGDTQDGFSTTQSFMSPRNDTDFSFSVSVFGDMGWLGSEERPMKIAAGGLEKNWSAVPTRKRLEALKDAGNIDMIWHVGDIAYADDAFDQGPLKLQYEIAYNGFMNWMQNLSATRPYMVSPGNHESECHSPFCLANNKKLAQSLRNFSAYNTRWNMPSNASQGRANMWYSYDYGPVHFVSINTETDWSGAGEEKTGDSHDPELPAGSFGEPGEYLAWLEKDLAAADQNRNQRPWIVAAGHREFKVFNESYGHLLTKYNVDLYLCGHAHQYARYAPGVTDEDATKNFEIASPRVAEYSASLGLTRIVTGGAGCDEMPNIGISEQLELNRLAGIQSYSVVNNTERFGAPAKGAVYGTKLLTVGVLNISATQLSWKLYSSNTGNVLDQVNIMR